jgi:ElaA protein
MVLTFASMKNWRLQKMSDMTAMEWHRILALRAEVFVVEQHCAYQDPDGKDFQCYHLTMESGEALVAYARLVPPGVSYPEAAIGRVVTSSLVRGQGWGKALMEVAIAQTMKQFQVNEICISAQSYLLQFYTELGFVQEGEEYLEDDIPHWKMRRRESLG